MSEPSFNDIRDNLHIGMTVRSKSSVGLNEIIVHNPYRSKVEVVAIGIFGEGEVDARVEAVGGAGVPVRVLGFVGGISEELWGGFGEVEVVGWNVF
jgi:hypothetical protein